MIKRDILWWLCMLLLAVVVVWLLSSDQGYVLIVRNPYRIQISFNFLLVAIVLMFIGLHYSLRLIHFLRRMPTKKRSRQETLKLKAGNAALLEGMHALAEGDIEKAEVSAKLAHDLIQNSDLEKLIQALASAKNKQGALF